MESEPGGMTLSEEDRRLIGLWAAECAERVLPLFEGKAPSDTLELTRFGGHPR